MKKIHFIPAIIGLLLEFGCDPQQLEISKGHFSFGIQPSEIDYSNGRLNENNLPAYVNYSIKDSQGNITSNKIELFSFNDSYVTQPQLFALGSYVIEEFLILNDVNEVIYAIPKEGSDLANLVQDALPISFDIYLEEVAEINLEVIAIEEYAPGEFGYSTFGFEVLDLFELSITASIAESDFVGVVGFALEIVGKNAKGDHMWTKSWDCTEVALVNVPDKYDYYVINVMREGYITHSQYLTKDEMSQTDHLSFELIPENSQEIIILEIANGGKAYLSTDPCKKYVRIDLPENHTFAWGYVDRGAYDIGGLPLYEIMFSECNPSESNSIANSFCGNAINVFGNVPFAGAGDLCQDIDLSLSNLASTLDDVVFDAYIMINYYNQAGELKFDSRYFKWN